MDALSLTNQTPVISFLWTAMQKARVPCDWSRDGASISKFNDQRVFCNDNVIHFGHVMHSSEPILPSAEGRVEAHFFAVLQGPIQRHLRTTDYGEAGPRVEHG